MPSTCSDKAQLHVCSFPCCPLAWLGRPDSCNTSTVQCVSFLRRLIITIMRRPWLQVKGQPGEKELLVRVLDVPSLTWSVLQPSSAAPPARGGHSVRCILTHTSQHIDSHLSTFRHLRSACHCPHMCCGHLWRHNRA